MIYFKPGEFIAKGFIYAWLDAVFIEVQWNLEKRKVHIAKLIRFHIDDGQYFPYLVIPEIVEWWQMESKWESLYVVPNILFKLGKKDFVWPWLFIFLLNTLEIKVILRLQNYGYELAKFHKNWDLSYRHSYIFVICPHESA